ncbi:hypothetical protein [Pseudomonas sp. PSE1(2024)]|uniref:hypothetical protein n=1 Tax=Pseudomonas sp. PSE1(2024) TaxID=3228746 RepID=UPI003D9866DF
MPERKPAELTLRQLANTSFSGIYRKLLSKEKLSDRESIQLLSISIVLINQQCSNLKRLGYRIALFYGNVSGNYDALNEIAINNGLIPVSSVISAEEELGGDRKDSFGFNYISSYIDNFRDGGMVLTEQQMDLRRYFLEKNEGSIAVIAPTSYGKSELIVKAFQDNPKASVCIGSF